MSISNDTSWLWHLPKRHLLHCPHGAGGGQVELGGHCASFPAYGRDRIHRLDGDREGPRVHERKIPPPGWYGPRRGGSYP